jgi:hypothetical protein
MSVPHQASSRSRPGAPLFDAPPNPLQAPTGRLEAKPDERPSQGRPPPRRSQNGIDPTCQKQRVCAVRRSLSLERCPCANASVLAQEVGLLHDQRLPAERPRKNPCPREIPRRPDEAMPASEGLQRMGLRLGDIKELLDVRNRGTCPCGHTRVLVEQRLVDVQAEIDQLEQVRVSSSSLEEDVTPSAWTPTPWTGHVQ